MKLVIQRVKSASVSIDGQVYNAIQQGLLLLVGVGPEDDQKDLEYAVRKVTQMRIFSDEDESFGQRYPRRNLVNLSIYPLCGDKKRQPSCFYRGCQARYGQSVI